MPDKPTRFCFGCEPLGGSDWGDVDIHNIEESVLLALDHGVNFFDTASVYGLGLSESRLSRILGVKRHEIFIATKGGLVWSECNNGNRAIVSRDSSGPALKKSIIDSLRRLRLDCIPLFYVHWPDPVTPFSDTFTFLSQLQREGHIQHIGCSNFTPLQVLEASRYARIDFLQIPVNILGDSISEARAYETICSAKSISIVAYNVLASGLLTGKFSGTTSFPSNDRRSRLPLFTGSAFHGALSQVESLKAKIKDSNLSVAQFAIGQVAGLPFVEHVLLGIKSPLQFKQNLLPLISSF